MSLTRNVVFRILMLMMVYYRMSLYFKPLLKWQILSWVLISSFLYALFLSIFPETEDVNEQEQWIPLHHLHMHCLIALYHRGMLPFWRQSTFQSKKDHIITALIMTCISFNTETAQFSYNHITKQFWQAGTFSISCNLNSD